MFPQSSLRGTIDLAQINICQTCEVRVLRLLKKGCIKNQRPGVYIVKCSGQLSFLKEGNRRESGLPHRGRRWDRATAEARGLSGRRARAVCTVVFIFTCERVQFTITTRVRIALKYVTKRSSWSSPGWPRLDLTYGIPVVNLRLRPEKVAVTYQQSRIQRVHPLWGITL